MNGVVEFENNVPQELALLYLAGKPIDTQFGPRVMFSVKGGKKLMREREDRRGFGS